MLLVVVVFPSNYLNARFTENEFSTVKQFMQTLGLQIDDVAWTVGRTQTTRYTSQFGQVYFESPALNYTVYINDDPMFNYSTGILLSTYQ
jgi:hypothetical protein